VNTQNSSFSGSSSGIWGLIWLRATTAVMCMRRCGQVRRKGRRAHTADTPLCCPRCVAAASAVCGAHTNSGTLHSPSHHQVPWVHACDHPCPWRTPAAAAATAQLWSRGQVGGQQRT
jgi:hypothetical protein